MSLPAMFVREGALPAMAGIALLLAGVARAATCDAPLVVRRGAVAPNVLLVLDTSASMHEPLYHPAYDEGVIWPGTFEATRYYYVETDGLYAPSDFNAEWPSRPEAPLVQGAYPRQRGFLLGNYANWIYYHATDEQRTELPQATRMEVGKAALRAVVTQVGGPRYGLMVLDGSEGGSLLAEVGTDHDTILHLIDLVRGDGYTPAAGALLDALEYFQDDSAHAPIQFECQRSVVILVTDGVPTGDRSVPGFIGDQDQDGREPGTCSSVYPLYPEVYGCSDAVDDVAYYMAHQDLRPDLQGRQVLTTHTVGFTVEHPLLEETARNGGGLYQVAWDVERLVTALSTIPGDVASGRSAASAVALIPDGSGTGGHLYRSTFLPGSGKGFLEAYRLPYHDGDAPRWEAGALLEDRAPSSRILFTNVEGNQLSFQERNAADLMIALGASSPEEAAEIVKHVRGQRPRSSRDPSGWTLGDLVHSTPVVVGAPRQFVLEASYQRFLTTHAEREPVLYVGSNDGMLHAFHAETGEELWGYVPSGVHAALRDQTGPGSCRSAYVDLSPVAYDVQIQGTWRTVLFGGLRGGGSSYFALDVTDPRAPRFLWETPLPALTSSFTEPTIVGTSAYGALLWTGSGPSTAGQAWASALQVESGLPLFQLPVEGPSDGVNMLSAATAFDSDYDGYADVVYQGDLAGNLWRFWVHDASGAWVYSKMFQCSEPIQTRPVVAIDENEDIFVYFGTGRYAQEEDLLDSRRQRFYAVKDDGSSAPKTPADLLDQSSSIHAGERSLGWYFDLIQGPGERVTEPAIIVEGVVYFTSFAPSVEPCVAGGRSWLYRVDYRTGSAIDEKQGKPAEAAEGRAEALGQGIASRPVVNLGDEEIIIQSSNARLDVQELSISPRTIRVRAWREEFADTASPFDPSDGSALQ